MPILLDQQQQYYYRTERSRSLFSGLLGPAAAGDGVLFLVAIAFFEFSDAAKSALASSIHYALILSIFVFPILSKYAWRINRVMPVFLTLCSASLCVAAATDSGDVYIGAIMFGIFCYMLMAPMITLMWREQIDTHLRGRLFSQIGLMTLLLNLGFSYWSAWYIGDDISRYPPVIYTLAGSMLIAAVFSALLPEQRLQANKQNPISLLCNLWKDKLFGYISFTWMLLGLGNLASLPLRAEFLNVLTYDPDTILWLIAVIPTLGSILSTLMWGRLFDAINFIALRIAINLFFVASIVLFFQESYVLQIIGSVCFGIGRGGGSVAWNLWVTKFAREEQTGDYQSVHAFLTGCRGVLGPLAAYSVWAAFSMQTVVWICAAMVFASCLLLLPVIKYGRR